VGQGQDRQGATADRSDESGELRQGPRSKAEHGRDRHHGNDDDIEEIHPRSMNEAGFRAFRSVARRQPTMIVTGVASPFPPAEIV